MSDSVVPGGEPRTDNYLLIFHRTMELARGVESLNNQLQQLLDEVIRVLTDDDLREVQNVYTNDTPENVPDDADL